MKVFHWNTMKLRQAFVTLIVLVAAMYIGSSASGAITTWQTVPVTNGDWTLGTNWTGGVPGVADEADLTNTTSSYSVDFSGTSSINGLLLQNGTGKATTLNILSNSTLTTANGASMKNATLHVSANATFLNTGTSDGTGGAAVVNIDALGTLQWGTSGNNKGFFLSGGTSNILGTLKGNNVAANSYLQLQGNTVLNINGGTVISDKLLLGANNAGATINVTNNGTLTVRGDQFDIGSNTGNGYLGTTAVNIDTGGTVTNNGTLDIAMAPSGNSTTGTASLNIAGGSWTQTGVTTVGTARNGSINISGTGTFITNNNTFVGGTSAFTGTGAATASGLISMTGGNFTAHNASNNATVTVGNAITGSLVLSGGNMTVDALVASNGANSTVTFNGGTLNTKATTISTGSVFTVGNGTASAALVLSGGTHSFANGLAISNNASLSGSGAVVGNATMTGNGIVNLTAGSISGTFGVTGGNWNGAGSVTGAVTSSSGTLAIGSGANLTANGGLNITGGTLAASDGTSTITGNVSYTSSSNSTYAGVLAGVGQTLTLNNAGAVLLLTGTNTYTGATQVSAGTMMIGGGGIKGTSAITISAGVLALTASDVLAHAVTMTLSGGTLDAQTFANTLGVLTLSGNSSISLGVNGTLAFADSSGATWGNTLTIDITGFVSASSLRFGTTGTGLTVSQLTHFTSSGYTSFGLDSNGYLIGSSPEPQTWVLVGIGLTVLLFRRRRTQNGCPLRKKPPGKL